MIPESWYVSKPEKARILRLEKENRKKKFCDDIESRIKKAKTLEEIERIRKICGLNTIKKRKRNLLRKLREIALGKREIALGKREIIGKEVEAFLYQTDAETLKNLYEIMGKVIDQLKSANIMHAEIILNNFIEEGKEKGLENIDKEDLIKRIKEILETPLSVKGIEEKIKEIKEIKRSINEEGMFDNDSTYAQTEYEPTDYEPTDEEEEPSVTPIEIEPTIMPTAEIEAKQKQQKKEDHRKIIFEGEKLTTEELVEELQKAKEYDVGEKMEKLIEEKKELEEERKSIDTELLDTFSKSPEKIENMGKIEKIIHNIIKIIENYNRIQTKIKYYELIKSILTIYLNNLENPEEIIRETEKVIEKTVIHINIKRQINRFNNMILQVRENEELTDKEIRLIITMLLNEIKLKLNNKEIKKLTG